MSKPLRIRGDADPELFAALLSQVTWMSGRAGQTSRPAASKLGPKYTVVLFIKDAAKHHYELYPLAAGGPRAYRPAKQPNQRTTTPAWFFGRLNMADTLRLAGVPLPTPLGTLSADGGGGGAIAGTTDDAALIPKEELSAVFAQWRRLFLLNGAVMLLISAGLAGFALLIRPKT